MAIYEQNDKVVWSTEKEKAQPGSEVGAPPSPSLTSRPASFMFLQNVVIRKQQSHLVPPPKGGEGSKPSYCF